MQGGNTDKLLQEIDHRWDALTNTSDDSDKTRIALPHPFVAPSNGIFHGDQFYWDTYFTIIGLLPSGRVDLAKGMVDNLLYLAETFKFIPMRNRLYNTGISQPPFLTSMLRLIYEYTHEDDWLARGMELAEQEYWTYWRNEDPNDDYADHSVYRNLSRYADHYIVHQTAEHESGWDMSSRFNGRCLDILPVDLNSQLYKYETDFTWYFELHDKKKSDEFNRLANERKQTMNELMWNEQDGRYYDYDYTREKQTRFVAASCYGPLWANLASKEQAEAMKESLDIIIKPGGIVNSAVGSLPQKQWDHPNGWAPSQWLVISGLQNYGYDELAQELANRWVNLVADVYEQTGEIWEKYDVVHQKPGKEGRYQNQTGFGWTNGICGAIAERYF